MTFTENQAELQYIVQVNVFFKLSFVKVWLFSEVPEPGSYLICWTSTGTDDKDVHYYLIMVGTYTMMST